MDAPADDPTTGPTTGRTTGPTTGRTTGRTGVDPVVVVGAGISGVACARELVAAGLPVRVVDRGRRLGGRMASRRLAGRPTDLGASYLTASEGGDFSAVVEDWRARGLAFAWTDTFAATSPDEEPVDKPGPVRWGAAGGLRSLVEDLAAVGGVSPEEAEVRRVRLAPGGWLVDDAPARAVVLAMPDAQAVRLLGDPSTGDPSNGDSSNGEGPLGAARAALTRESEPILALAAWWTSRTWDGALTPGPFHGAFVNGDTAVSWIADDGRRRGDDAAVLVAHSTPDLAAKHLEDPVAAGPQMLAAVCRVLGIDQEPSGTHVHRWSLARPTGERSQPFHLAGGLGVCGDGWGESPKVETAWRSGRDLGRALAQQLGGR